MIEKVPPVMPERPVPVMPERPAPWDANAFMTDLRAKLDANRAARQARFGDRFGQMQERWNAKFPDRPFPATLPQFGNQPAMGGPGPMPRPAALNQGNIAPPAFNPRPQPAIAGALAQRKGVGGGGIDRPNPNVKAY